MNENESVIYCGPNVLSLGLQKSQVFLNGLPPYVLRAIDKIPEIKGLIVFVDELCVTRSKINRSGSHESNLYTAIQKKADKLKTERTAK